MAKLVKEDYKSVTISLTAIVEKGNIVISLYHVVMILK